MSARAGRRQALSARLAESGEGDNFDWSAGPSSRQIAAILVQWPYWWDWELVLTPHLERRMEDRGFSELDLRSMLQHAAGIRFDSIDGRFVVDVHHGGRPWEVIVEPDGHHRRLVVVTAYPVDRAWKHPQGG